MNNNRFKQLQILLILLLFSFSIKSIAQSKQHITQPVHGLDYGIQYDNFAKMVYSLGYQFQHPLNKTDGWYTRFQHRYFLDYTPKTKSLGVTANLAFNLVILKLGADFGYNKIEEEEKSDAKSNFFLSPQVGIDLVYLDFTAGPTFNSQSIEEKHIGFKIACRINYPIFNQK